MKKTLLALAFFYSAFLCSAQKEANIWYFGEYAGLDFNSGTPVSLLNSSEITHEGCASIADKTTGALLFYTDGTYVWDQTGTIMPNGTGLGGNSTATQSAVIVPQPGSTTLFYIFTVDWQAGIGGTGSGGLNYNIVDMTLNGGLGDVTALDSPLIAPTSEKVTAVRHCNGRDIWVVTHQWNTNGFYTYLLTPAGISAPVISYSGIVHQDVGSGENAESIGYMKFSPDAKKLALACYVDLNTVQLFDFDNSTGIISNPYTDTNFPDFSGSDGPYGVSFSPDNSRLYVSVFGFDGDPSYIYQYNMLAGNGAAIIASRTLIASETYYGIGALQIGPDGKMYVAHNYELGNFGLGSGSNYLDVINNPNGLGAACNYVFNGQNLGLTGVNLSWWGLPDIVETFLLPKYTANLTYPSCNGNSTLSFTDSLGGTIGVSWDFGDPSSGTSDTSTLQNPTHTFSGAGFYTVTVTLTNNCKTDVFSQTINVSIPLAVAISPLTPVICNGQSVSLTASGGVTYTWSPTGGLSSGSGTVVSANPSATTTYTVTGTDGSGCSNTSSVTVTVNAKPTININPTAPILCNGLSVLLTAGGASTYVWSPTTGLSSGSGATVTANPTTTSTYTVTGTNGSSCTNTASVTVTINPKPTITITPPSATLCNGQSQSLTAGGGSTYVWSPTTGLSSGTGTIVSANPATTTTYTVTGTDANGCTNTSSVTVTINPKPTITVGPLAPVLCNGQFVSLTGGGGNTYIWSPTTGLSSGSGTTVSANPTATTTYTVTGTDGNSCTNTASLTITVNPKPTITINPVAPVLCSGQSVSLTGGGGTTYTWNPTTGLSSASGTTVSANPITTATYTVTGTDGNGCTNTASVTVTVNPKPTITVSPISSVLCNGQSVSLTGGGGNTYTWSPSGGLSSGSGTIVSANPTSTTSYTVTGTDGNGCTNTASATVTVNPKPTITVSPLTPVLCNGQFVSLTGGGGNTYIWNPTTGLSSGSGTTVSANPSTTTSYTVTGTDGNGCTNTASVTVTVNPLPLITASPVSTVLCNGQSVSLTGGGGTNYVWSPSTGLSSGSGTTVTANPTTSTTYTVTGTDVNGCTNTASAVVNINPKPTISVNPPSPTLCSGQSTSLTAGGANTYVWSPGTGLSSGTGTVVSANPSTTTTYTVTGTDGNGCTNTTTVTVTVNTVLTVAVNPLNPVLCLNQSVSLTGGGAITYSWSPTTGLSSGSGTTVSANPTSTTTYTVTGTAGTGCSSTASVTVTVNQLPLVTASPLTSVLCNGQSVSLTGGGGISYIWSPTTGLSSGSGTTVSASPSSSATYTVTGTDGNGCTNTASATITVNQLPVVAVSPIAPAICNGQSISLTGSGANTYIWSPGAGLSSTSGTTVSANPSSSTPYTVTGTDGNGCTNTGSVIVTVNSLPSVNAGSDANICPNDSSQLNVTGPPVGSTYSWTPSTNLSCNNCSNPFAFPQATTTYTVLVTTLAGCSATDSVSVIVTPLAPLAGPDTAVCYGSFVQLNASGGLNYQWSPSAGLNNPNSATPSAILTSNTTYTVTVSSGSCSSTATVTVVVHPVVPTPSITQSADTLFCSYDPVYTSYQWYYKDTIIPNATDSFYVASQSGNYNVAVSDQYGCQISVGINIILSVGLQSISELSGFSLYPNPAGNELRIKSSELRIKEVDIYNMLGEQVFTKQQETQNRNQEIQIDISSLSSGIYFIHLQGAQGNWVGRFVKE